MKEDIYSALDVCLKWMDQGSDLESCLARYPEYADELRPLLMASTDATSLPAIEVSPEVLRRNKARILNAAGELREQKSSGKAFFANPAKRIFRFSLAAALALLLLAGIGGTGLVRASATSLPGDQFYPVKLTWENVLLKLAVSQSERQALEDQFEQERVDEVEELISENRSEKVKFYGQVDGIFPDQIIVSGITVLINPDTRLDGVLQMQALVRVEGRTASNGLVLADKIKVEGPSLIPGENINPEEEDKKPTDDDLDKSGKKSGGGDSEGTPLPADDRKGTPEGGEDASGKGEDSGNREGQKTPEPESFELEGTVKSFDGSVIVVNDRSIYIIPVTEIRGNLVSGSQVSIRGYVNEQGALVALRLEVKSSSDGNGDGGGGNDGGNSSGSDDEFDPTNTPKPEEPPDD